MFSALAKFLLLFLISLLFFACKKDIKQTTKGKSDPQMLLPFTTSGPGGTNCYDYSPLTPQPDGSYSGWIENVPITVTGIIYQAYDENGYPITYKDGDPFLGQVNINSSTPAEVLYNSQSPQDDQIAIRIFQMGVTTIDLDGYKSDLNAYLAGQNVALGLGALPLYLMQNTMPNMAKYITQGSTTYHDTTIRLIRINPVQVGVDASGNPIITTFAIAPTCYPRPGVRSGNPPPSGTSVTLKNSVHVFGSTSPPSPISVDFIQYGSVIKTINFPTLGTTSSPISISPGSYILRFTVPTGYENFYLNYTINPGTPGNNFWEGGKGSTTVTTSTITISSGTAYTIVASTN